MARLRWRARSFLLLFTVFGLCVGIQYGPPVSARDKTEKSAAGVAGSAAADANEPDAQPTKTKTKASAAKKKTRQETPKKKKGAPGGDDSDQSSTSSGSASGGGAMPPVPGASSAASNSSPGDRGTRRGSEKTAAGNIAGSPSPPASAKNFGSSKNGAGAGVPLPGAQQGPNPELVQKVMDIQNRATPELLKQKGIVGTATGLDDDGNVVIRVYTTGADNPKIPATIENIAVVEIQSGNWHFRQGAAFDPKARQPRPVPIGVSTISENGACLPIIAAGTIGCRLRSKDGGVFALSNNHVWAAENAGVTGDKIIQPGSLDEFNDGLKVCDKNDVIGTLFKFKPYDVTGPNLIDAAVMKTDTSEVGNATPPPPIAYGPPRSTVVVRPFLGMRVQKFGRTTGHTTGTISALNQTVVLVAGSLGLLLFVNQIEVTGDGFQPFSNQGDSGSLIVTMDRFPVALLFAGGGIFTNGNPIQTVLDEFDMTIDGDDSAFISPGKEGRANPGSP
jgi:hypothetical protein